MPVLVLMCGLAFSGKSTAADRIVPRLEADLVSLDVIHAERGLDPGRDVSERSWAETGRLALARTEHLLAQGRSVVVDDTFSYRAQRDRFREAAARQGAKVLIVFVDPPEAVARARLEANARHPTRRPVAPEVFEHIRREFERPGADEPAVRFTGLDAVEEWLEREGQALTG